PALVWAGDPAGFPQGDGNDLVVPEPALRMPPNHLMGPWEVDRLWGGLGRDRPFSFFLSCAWTVFSPLPHLV
uniref:Uncharacterized protein n=1 Tax=Mustela putorius furo TaxID=9669 RepID=M3YHN6_MUSPF